MSSISLFFLDYICSVVSENTKDNKEKYTSFLFLKVNIILFWTSIEHHQIAEYFYMTVKSLLFFNIYIYSKLLNSTDAPLCFPCSNQFPSLSIAIFVY